jgi:uncharacterized membrane protein YdjX (TVP38/TMEM64 family)
MESAIATVVFLPSFILAAMGGAIGGFVGGL